MLMVIALLSSIEIFSQTKKVKVETVKIFGNCDSCKSNIEKAGNQKNVAHVEWNKDSKMATLTYDSKKTNHDEILKRIALAGYDSEEYLSPDEAYAKLPECCKYERAVKAKTMSMPMDMKDNTAHNNHSDMSSSQDKGSQDRNDSQLNYVFDKYFALKDALIKSNPSGASASASELSDAIKKVDMSKLASNEHNVWMKVFNDITSKSQDISKSKDLAKQRSAFASLSDRIYKLSKVSKNATPVYYQHCPMFNNGKGANWLSKESTIKNPYYGSQMLTCGSTVDTIKN